MIDHEEKILLFLKFSLESKSKALKLGNNNILAENFPELSNEKVILFNVDLKNEQEAYLRTFDHFPLMIKFIFKDEKAIPSSNNPILLRKSTLIKINSILNIHIFPLFTNNSNYYFSFEGSGEGGEAQEKPMKDNIDNKDYNDIKEINEEDVQVGIVAKKANEEDLRGNQIIEEQCRMRTPIQEEETKKVEDVIVEDVVMEDRRTEEIRREDAILKSTPFSNPEIIPRKIKIIIDEEEEEDEGKIEIKNGRSTKSLNILKMNLSNTSPSDVKEKDSLKDSSKIKKSPIQRILTRSTSSSEILINRQKEIEKEKEKGLLERKRKRTQMKQQIYVKEINVQSVLSEPIRSNSRKSILEVINPIASADQKQAVNEPPIVNVPAKAPSNVPVKLPCSICLDPISQASGLDKCGHEFCKECIDQWAVLSSHCPLCKEEFRKIIYWESNQKLEKKVRKRKFKYEEEEEEPWYNNCAEACMVCQKSNDEHLLLVCDRCTYNICHTYCAGLDLIPDEEWLCNDCLAANRRRRGREEINANPLNNNITNAGQITVSSARRQNSDANIALTRSKSKTKVGVKREEDTKNINIPISCKLQNTDVKRNSVNFNVNVNLQITNTNKTGKIRHIHIKSNKIKKKSIPFTEPKTRKGKKRYELRKKKKQ